jgi:small-conductance mechanosensitive channel
MVSSVFAGINWQLWVAPVMLIGGGLLLGIILERLFIGTMRRIFSRASIELNGHLTDTVRGVILGLFIIVGLHLATYTVPDITPDNLEIVRKLLFILGMLIAIRLASKIAVLLVRFYLNRSEHLQALPSTSIFENVIQIVVYIVGGLVLLQTLGVSVIPILTALGVGGLAISLALQDTLANMFAGVNMILAQQIKIGDFVKLQEGNYEGTVEDIGWRNTIIRQMNNNLVIVPNSKMSSTIITNSTLPLPEMSLVVEISVAYGSNLSQVEALTIEVAEEVLRSTEGAIPDFAPFIRYHTFGDSGLHFSVILRVRNLVDQFLVKHEFIKRLYARYEEAGIEIPFPQRTIHLSGISIQGGGLGEDTAPSYN